MSRKRIFTKDEIKRIEDVYESGEITISALARELNIDRSTLRRYAVRIGLDKTMTRNTNSGIKYEWTETKDERLKELYKSDQHTVEDIADEFRCSSDTIYKRSKELGISKVPKNMWSEDNLNYLKEQANKLPYVDIARHLGVSASAVSIKLKEDFFEIYSKNRGKYIDVPTEELLRSLANPRLASPDIAKEFDISEGTVQKLRKKFFGQFKLQLDTSTRITTAERKVIGILENLDLAYITHKYIDKWNVDIYLGQKHIIEVDGDYWHSKDVVKVKDRKKIKYLESEGYKILSIKESELIDLDKVQDVIIKWVSLIQ